MTIRNDSRLIPGTQMDRVEMGDVTGKAFLDKIFYVQNGIMLAQIRVISGIDGSTLQNWVKRGWAGKTVNKKYSMDQLARILLINMMRDAITFERIDYVLHYLNGDIDSTEDDIIAESLLYDDVCRIIELAGERESVSAEELRAIITDVTKDYPEVYAGARERLNAVLEIIVTSYESSLLMKQANARLDTIFAG